MTSNVWHCFCTYCTKEYRCLLHCTIISALSCHPASCRHIQCWKQDQKYKTNAKTRPKLQDQDWGRSCHKTAVSDPKTDAPMQCTRGCSVHNLVRYSKWRSRQLRWNCSRTVRPTCFMYIRAHLYVWTLSLESAPQMLWENIAAFIHILVTNNFVSVKLLYQWLDPT